MTPAEFASRCGQVADDLADLSDVDTAAADQLADLARPRTPRRTGRLAKTVRVVGGQVVAGGPTAPYAPPVHWGTRVMAARPWISQTADQAADRVADFYADQVADLVLRPF
jgi:hypothetical protein